MSKPEINSMISQARAVAVAAILNAAQSALTDEAKLKIIRAQIEALDAIENESE